MATAGKAIAFSGVTVLVSLSTVLLVPSPAFRSMALGVLAWPVLGLRTGMPSIAIIPTDQSARAGYVQVVSAFGPGAPGQLQVLTPVADQARVDVVLTDDRGVAAAIPGSTNAGWALIQVIPTTDASAPATGTTIDRLRTEFPSGSRIGGAAAENHDLDTALSSRTPLVFGLLIGLGFLLLLIALGSPLIAFAGVITHLASIAAAFGVAS